MVVNDKLFANVKQNRILLSREKNAEECDATEVK